MPAPGSPGCRPNHGTVKQRLKLAEGSDAMIENDPSALWPKGYDCGESLVRCKHRQGKDGDRAQTAGAEYRQ